MVLVLTRTCYSHFVLPSGTHSLLVKPFVGGVSVEGVLGEKKRKKHKRKTIMQKLFSHAVFAAILNISATYGNM